MNDLKLEADKKTPGIELNASSGEMKFWGRSIPENSLEFYQEVYQWIDAYSKSPKQETTATFQLEYFNTSSSKCILDILRKLEELQRTGKTKVTVNWLYEEDDEDMMEAGDDYQTIVELDFRISVA